MLILHPRGDLRAIRLQPISLRCGPRPRSTDHAPHLDQPHHLVLGWRWPIGRQPKLLSGVHILLHRLARHATGASDRTLRLAQLPATNDLDDLHATQLPISHSAHTSWRTW